MCYVFSQPMPWHIWVEKGLSKLGRVRHVSYKKAEQSQNSSRLCFPMQKSQFPKKLFYTLQHLGKLRESREALESHDACSTTKKVYRKGTVVFWADANAGCLICSSENLHTHQQVISFGQRFCISLRNVPKNKWHMAEERE